MSLVAPGASLPAKSLYDTSIYINAIRSQVYYKRLFPHFSRSLSTTYFRAVVAQELKYEPRGSYTLCDFLDFLHRRSVFLAQSR